ncbi:hypothetical protein [Vibrio echinoideorum]|uniref:Glycosyltransferase n=1 Tax=Vibrio echinoideorum TaxID=2100116 RepID=A0ABU9FT14_9VIBR
MKVLFYGEYSGLATSLRDGFRTNGIQADVFTTNEGDGFKKINTDYSLKGKGIKRFVSFMKMMRVIFRYDVYIIMNPTFLSIKNFGPVTLLGLWLLGKRTYLFAAGDDVEYVKCFNDGTLSPCPLTFAEDLPQRYFQRYRDIIIHELIASLALKIIPISFEYKFCWDRTKYKNKVTNVLTLPGFDQNIPYNTEIDSKNIVILHGLNRAGQKGSKYIIEALRTIERDFDNVEVRIVNKLSLSDYKDELRHSDIVLDQCVTNSYGMNAIIAMNYGNIVISGCGQELESSTGLTDIPVFNSEPDVEQIVETIRDLLSSDTIERMKRQSYIFGLKHHSNEVASSKLLDIIS